MTASSESRAVAIVGDAAMASTLRRCSAVIEDLAGMRTHVLPLDFGAPHTAADALNALPADVGVGFLSGAHREFACHVRALAGVPMVTDHDTIAIALTVSTLTTLARAGRRPRTSQVVIAGADTLPILCPLLMVAGIGSVITWNSADAYSFPLRRVVVGSDAVVNLLPSDTVGMGDMEPPVIAPDPDRDPLLALPGLLRAIVRTRAVRLDVEVHQACVFALVMATPPDELRPDGPDRVLTDRVAEAATTALRGSANRPFDTSLG